MFSIITELIVNFINRITEKSIDSISKNISDKRTMMSSFITFYNATEKLEFALLEINELLLNFSENHSVMNSYIKNKMTNLYNECDGFFNEYKKIKTILKIYDSELAMSIGNVIGVDDRNFQNLNRLFDYKPFSKEPATSLELFFKYLPEQKKGLKKVGGLTSKITYPISRLNAKDIDLEAMYKNLLEANLINANTYQKDFRILKKELLKKIKRKTIDLNNLNELNSAIEINNINIKAIIEIRELLKHFIKENFQLDKLLS